MKSPAPNCMALTANSTFDQAVIATTRVSISCFFNQAKNAKPSSPEVVSSEKFMSSNTKSI